jgi:dihydrodipicolinate synthase/N-acetylneuraminate lyase
MASIDELRTRLGEGMVIPACPLALNSKRQLDPRRQRALFRYYLAAGAGGLAVGVHTTQFAIRAPEIGLFRPVLELAAEEVNRSFERARAVRVAGICGSTKQAVAEASLAAELGYYAGLLNLGELKTATNESLIKHCRTVAEIIPLFGFYLQPAAGGRALTCEFWRMFAEIERVVAIKIAPFNRYQTIDVVRAVAESGREDIALYTGNDDNIVLDLLTPYQFEIRGKRVTRHIVGGLLGHWAVWTKRAVELHDECRRVVRANAPIPSELLAKAAQITDANAAIFDAVNGFAGCIPGIHEILRRQGLLEGIRCLNPGETLGPGQKREIERVSRSYPHLNDDAFVSQHLNEWLDR